MQRQIYTTNQSSGLAISDTIMLIEYTSNREREPHDSNITLQLHWPKKKKERKENKKREVQNIAYFLSVTITITNKRNSEITKRVLLIFS